MQFELIGTLTDVETVAVGPSLRQAQRLERVYGFGRWRKLKGFALIELGNGYVCRAERHWYEASGIGRKEMKIKRLLDEEG